MRARSCGLSAELRTERQRSYCGTCKTMGRLYGQPTRLLLNHDAVFLGELLLALSPSTTLGPSYTVRRCASLPKASALSLPLVYAATANLLLAEFKVTDKIQDSSRLWSIAKLGLSRSLQKAHRMLRSWQFPIHTLIAQSDEQARRERSPQGQEIAGLCFLAEPTATATRLFFSEGARVVGASGSITAMAGLGEAFGRIVYVLDALEDRQDDLRSGQFNALEASGVSNSEARAYLQEQQKAATAFLRSLPMENDRLEMLVRRLLASVTHAISKALPMVVATAVEDEEEVKKRPAGTVTTTKIQRRKRRLERNGGGCGSNCCNDCYDAICCCELTSCACDGCSCCATEACCECGSCCECGACCSA